MNDIFPFIPAIKLARPTHWTKNFALFAALLFSGLLNHKAMFLIVFLAFWAFNFITSATYIFNDIKDVKKDVLNCLLSVMKEKHARACKNILANYSTLTLLCLVMQLGCLGHYLHFLKVHEHL